MILIKNANLTTTNLGLCLVLSINKYKKYFTNSRQLLVY